MACKRSAVRPRYPPLEKALNWYGLRLFSLILVTFCAPMLDVTRMDDKFDIKSSWLHVIIVLGEIGVDSLPTFLKPGRGEFRGVSIP